MDVTHQTDDEQAALWNGRAGRAWVEAQELLDQMFKPFEDLLVEAVSAGSGSAGARRRLRHGQHDARRRAAARSEGPLRRHRHFGADDRRRPGPRRTGRHAGKLHPRRRADPRVRACELRHDHLALRRDVLRRSRPGLREPAACRKRRRRAPVHRLAERRGKSVHDDGRARRGAAPAEPPARRPDAPGQFAFADQRRVSSHPGGERLGRDRHPADRCCLHPAREGVGPLPDPARSASAWSFRRRTTGLARRSSKRSAPPSIPTCTERKSALPRPAGWSALARRLHPPRQGSPRVADGAGYLSPGSWIASLRSQ